MKNVSNVDLNSLARHLQQVSVKEEKKKDDVPKATRVTTPEYESFEAFGKYCNWSFDEDKCSSFFATKVQNVRLIERTCKLDKQYVTQTFLIESRPVIVTDSQNDWNAMGRWCPQFFSEDYGEAEVIANDRAPARLRDRVLNRPQKSVRMRVSDYVSYLDSRLEEEEGKDVPLYLNGWHAFKHFPKLLQDISYPDSHYFIEDHTRLILQEIDKAINRNKNMNASSSSSWAHDTDVLLNKIFMGPAGNITRLHFDAHDAHGWLSQIQGKKLFVLFPPEDTSALYPLENEATTQSPVDPLNVNLSTHPLYSGCHLQYAILKENETLLIPAGWWHYAVSLEPSITVMRNFYNALTNVNGLVKLFANTYKKSTTSRGKN